MKIEQISIFLENRAGRLSDITKCLADAKINIRALSLADTSDFGILRLIVNNTEKAKTLLKENGFTLGSTSVVAIEIGDTPGELNSVISIVSKNNINIEYMYAYMPRSLQKAVLIFRFDRTDQAIEIFTQNNIKVLSAKEIYSSE